MLEEYRGIQVKMGKKKKSKWPKESDKSNSLLLEREFYSLSHTNFFNAQLAIASSKLQVEELLVFSNCLQFSW